MAGVAVIVGCRDMGIMGQLAVLSGVTGVTFVVWLNDRAAARGPGYMADITGHQVGAGMVVMGLGKRAGHIMTGCAGRSCRVAGVTVATGGRDMRTMGQLSVLGGMTFITLIVWFNDRGAARGAGDMTLRAVLV
jgi:hypothetical protein